MNNIEYEDIKAQCAAGSRLSRCTLVQAEVVLETMRQAGCPMGGVALLPMGLQITNIIPVENVNGIVEEDRLRYYVQANGIWMNAGMNLGYIFPVNWGMQNLFDMVGWKPGK